MKEITKRLLKFKIITSLIMAFIVLVLFWGVDILRYGIEDFNYGHIIPSFIIFFLVFFGLLYVHDMVLRKY